MSLVIRQNLMAEAALRNLSQTYAGMDKSIQRLSSGLRIVGAADDAAGLAVREGMRSEVAALEQGMRNANDAISMLQTFDGAAQVIDEKLIRMKELALQASTGTYSSAQRAVMHSEFSAMRAEIERIAQATAFNKIYGIAGSAKAGSSRIKIHFGPSNSAAMDFYFVTVQDFTASALGLRDLSLDSQHSAQASLTALDSAINTKVAGRAHFGALMNRLANTVTAIGIQRENLMAAESQISDADIATEMSALVRQQVLSQAGVAMLSQANMVPQMALALLS